MIPKSTSPPKLWALVLLVLFSGVNAFSQQILTTVTQWNKNAYLHLPGDYATTGTKTYPIIIFFPGLGETDGAASKLLVHGPSKFVADGHNMEFLVNGVVEKPIVISVQPGLWPAPDYVLWRIELGRCQYLGFCRRECDKCCPTSCYSPNKWS